MNLRIALSIGARYVVSPRDFLSSVASLSVMGLALSVAVLLVVQAVLSGFEYEFRERMLGTMPHVSVFGTHASIDESQLRFQTSQIEGIVAQGKIVSGNALIVVPPPIDDEPELGVGVEPRDEAASFGRAHPVYVAGITPQRNHFAPKLLDYVDENEVERLQPGAFEVLLGKALAENLGVAAGDFVTLMLPIDQVSLVGFLPRQKRVRVAGLIETKTSMDRASAYMHIEDSARFFRGRQAVVSYGITLDDPFRANSVHSLLARNLATDDLDVRNWSMGEGARFYGAIMSSRYLLLLVFSMLVAVAAFNLVSTVAVMVSERRRDIAVLRTLGSERPLITIAFLTAGLSIAIIGLSLGCVIGVCIGWLLEIGLPLFERLTGINLLSQYFVHSLSLKFEMSDFVTVLGIGLGLCLIAVAVPAIRATGLNPTEILRHD